MKILHFLLGICLGLCACGNADSELPDNPDQEQTILSEEHYALITGNGQYTFVTDAENQAGSGERVAIPTAYYMAKYAVTNRAWNDFLKATSRSAPRYWPNGEIPTGREEHPVLWVSYHEAEAYCDWLEGQYEGFDFRLPTEAEWEYAALGGAQDPYPWGTAQVSYQSGVLDARFNYNAVIASELLQTPDRLIRYNHSKSSRYGEQEPIGKVISIGEKGAVSGWINHSDYTGFVYTDLFTEINDAGGNTCAVDAYPKGVSYFGCYNMCGNCWEWTSTEAVAMNGAEKGDLVQVIRGGSWYATQASCKATFRGEGRAKGNAFATVGFRVVAVEK